MTTHIKNKRFGIFYRDGFRCVYCGGSPGRDNLEIDHLIPRSKGGSDDELNLVTACTKCNSGKSDDVVVPHSWIDGTDADGFYLLNRWQFGVWGFKVGSGEWWISGASRSRSDWIRGGCYEFEIDEVWLDDWEAQIHEKAWPPPHYFSDFVQCFAVARRLIVGEVTSQREKSRIALGERLW
jgi:hypothetical protein